MLATGAHRELARAPKAGPRQAVVGGWPAGVEVGRQSRLAQAKGLIDLLDRAPDRAGHDVVALAVKQPDPLAGEIGRIVNDLPRPSLPDQANRILGLGRGEAQAPVAVA